MPKWFLLFLLFVFLLPGQSHAGSLRISQSEVDQHGIEHPDQPFIRLLWGAGDTPLSGLEQRHSEDRFFLPSYLYYLLLSGDGEPWENLFNSAVVCGLSGQLMVEMPSEPLYQQIGAECQQLGEAGFSITDSYYSDAACLQTVRYRPMSLSEYCIGNSEPAQSSPSPVHTADSHSWYLSPATRLDIGVDSIAMNHQPYTSRAVYKQAAGERGECQLEMYVHKRLIAATDLKPLLMLHGGSWERRRDGMAAVESQISSYTEQGFIVFAPSYRLVGETEGNPACNGASGEQIVADINDAMNWVQEYGAEYGAKAGPVAVFGQSAGGHLALRLAVQQPKQISRMLLLYPPTDFADFVGRWRAGELGEQTDGLDTLQGFIGTPLDEVKMTDPVIVQNSIPALIAGQPERFPPLFIIHGSGDTLVPISQSTRLCNALSGDPEQGPVNHLHISVLDGLSQVFACDQYGSQLHVITAAEHMLDGCLFSVLCPAGGLESQRVVRDSLRAGRNWLKEQPTVPGSAGLLTQWR